MPVYRCKMCGGTLNVENGSTVCECEFCGAKQTVPSAAEDKKEKLFDRAQRLLSRKEFDKAGTVYESIINEYPNDAEGYWGSILCRYGIEYVDDPATGEKKPTCHRASYDSIMDDSDFELVMENSDALSRSLYRQQAEQIEEIRKSITAISGKEDPYDIFICYKETDENGSRTEDSVMAQDIYDRLTEKGYRVFFSRISLEDKLGHDYEPYIFAALNSAKVMLVVGTRAEYLNSVWVTNEWSRYLKLMIKDHNKYLIPCFKGMEIRDLPPQFARFQAQDMGRIGAEQDLLRGVKKLLDGTDEHKSDTPVSAGIVKTPEQEDRPAPVYEKRPAATAAAKEKNKYLLPVILGIAAVIAAIVIIGGRNRNKQSSTVTAAPAVTATGAPETTQPPTTAPSTEASERTEDPWVGTWSTRRGVKELELTISHVEGTVLYTVYASQGLASGSVEWVMNCTEDGNRLVYAESKETKFEMETGEQTVNAGSGYFEITEELPYGEVIYKYSGDEVVNGIYLTWNEDFNGETFTDDSTPETDSFEYVYQKTYMYVVGCNENISLRVSPDKAAQRIAYIPLYSQVEYIGEAANGFKQINYAGYTGYSLSEYLDYYEPQVATGIRLEVYNCNENISLRTGPATTFDAICTIPLGSYVDFIEERGDFYLISYNGFTGYSLKKYLRQTQSVADENTQTVAGVSMNIEGILTDCGNYYSAPATMWYGDLQANLPDSAYVKRTVYIRKNCSVSRYVNGNYEVTDLNWWLSNGVSLIANVTMDSEGFIISFMDGSGF